MAYAIRTSIWRRLGPWISWVSKRFGHSINASIHTWCTHPSLPCTYSGPVVPANPYVCTLGIACALQISHHLDDALPVADQTYPVTRVATSPAALMVKTTAASCIASTTMAENTEKSVATITPVQNNRKAAVYSIPQTLANSQNSYLLCWCGPSTAANACSQSRTGDFMTGAGTVYFLGPWPNAEQTNPKICTTGAATCEITLAANAQVSASSLLSTTVFTTLLQASFVIIKKTSCLTQLRTLQESEKAQLTVAAVGTATTATYHWAAPQTPAATEYRLCYCKQPDVDCSLEDHYKFDVGTMRIYGM
jgi:hypothetical protein